MDSSNYDHEWKKKLPIGFHFVPTDEELITYLRFKSSNSNIPLGIFNDLDIYQHEPHELYGFAEKQWNECIYFFTPLMKKYDKGNKIKRDIHLGKGYWKASQARKKIFNNNNNQIGTKTSLVYYEVCPRSQNGRKTSWLMLEYRFPDKFDSLPQSNRSDYELTLCVIYYFNKKKNVDDQIVGPVKSDDIIPLQSSIDQNSDHSLYTSWPVEHSLLQQHQPLINWTDGAFSSTMQPSFFEQHQLLENWTNVVTSSTMQSTFFVQQSLLINWIDVASSSTMQSSFSVQQHQPLTNWTDIASDSTMQPNFYEPLYNFMYNFNTFSSNIPQNYYDFHGFNPSTSPYLNLENFHYLGDDTIGHISNNSVDFVDQNTLETCVAPISQDDQRPSMDGQDHDHQQDNNQLKMKIKM